MKDYWKHHC